MAGAYAIRNEFVDMRNIMGRTKVNIVDGGTNVGLFTKCLKMYFPDSKVYAFEPQKHLNLGERLNGFKDVHVVEVALGEKNKNVDFYIAVDDKESQTSSLLETVNQRNTQKIIVPMVTLDSWAKENGNLKIDIIKLDLEGYDLKALEGAKELLSSCVKMVFLEFHFISIRKDQPNFCDYVQFLNKYGFKLFNFYGLSTRDDGYITGGNALFVKHLEG